MSLPALKPSNPPIGNGPFLPYGRQTIEEDDIAAVVEVLRGDFLTTGPAVSRFETALSSAVGARRSVVCSSGTAALYMASRALGIGEGSKVIVPAITFLATANAPHLAGAEIIFADVDPDTGLMRPDDLNVAIERAGRVDAVFNVHLAGQTGDIEEIAAIAAEHGAPIVDDACHALGAGYVCDDGYVSQIGANRHCTLTVFSFHPVKTIAMGEGGAVTTNDAGMARKLENIRNHGVTRDASQFINGDDAFGADGTANHWYYEMHQPEFNWRANDIQCALGTSQLGKLGRFVARRRALAAAYDTMLASLGCAVRPMARTRLALPAWHLYAARIDFENLGISRGEAMRNLAAANVGSQVHYYPVHRQPYYAKRYGRVDLPGADHFYRHTLSLPLFASMTLDDVKFVSETLARVLQP